MGKLVPFQPPPGVFKNGTPYQAKGRWSDCNLVRWKDGLLQPLGGWEKVIDPGSSVTGVGRAMISWRDFKDARWLAIGTSEKLYIFTSLSGSAVNITPSTLIAGNESGEIGLGFGVGVFGGTATTSSVEDKTDISFASPATINSTSTAFTDATTVAQATPSTTTLSPDGPTPFAVGDEIEVLGSVTANNRSYTGAGGITTGSHRVVSVTTDASTGASTMTIGPSSSSDTGGGGSAIYAGTITSLNITNAGTGISAGATKTLTATGGGGSGFAGTYTIDSAGAIDTVTITNAGSGYTTTPTIVINDLPTALGGTFTVSSDGMDMVFTITNGGVATVGTIATPSATLNPEATYTNVALGGGSGSGVKATVVTDDGEGDPYVISVTITTIGTGYVISDSLTIPKSIIGGTVDATCVVATIKHGLSIGGAFRVSTTGTFPAGDQYGNPNIVLAADTDFYVFGGYDEFGEASGFTDDTWKPSIAAGDTEGALYFENAGSGTHSFLVTASTASVTAGMTGTITTAAASGGTPITLARTRRFGNENVATSSLVLEASSWIFDLWGENLVGMSTADGKIVEWDPSTTGATSVIATVVSNAPISNSAILVSKQRHLFAFGAGGNNKKIQWSDAENNTTWTATATNQAGSFEIDTSGKILAGKTVGDRILVWTSTDLHAVDWVGMPYVYGRKKIGDSCGAISNRAMVTVGDQAFWMSYGGFFQYQGSVQPLKCDVQDFLFKDLNRIQDSKIYASINPEFFEVSWWYASSDSDEILKYVTYNYSEGWWSIGSLCRTAFATGSPGVFPNPIGLADDGTVYEHETAISSGKRTTSQVAQTDADISDFDRKLVTGTDATDDVGLCFAETVMEIGDGENIVNVTQLVTDTAVVGDNGLRFKFKTSYTPNGTESTSSNYDLAADGYTDIREQGRQFTYRVESGFDQYWELGSIRAEMSAGGRR